jgi:glycerol-3-phosphate acyltransferase PlsY
VLRIAGRGPAAVTLLLDIAKGAAAARAGGALGGAAGSVAAGLGAVVGHSWPAFARFRGGKSVATTFGAALAVSPPVAGAAMVTGLLGLAITHRMSVLSLAGGGGAVVAAAALTVRRRDPQPLALVVPAVAIVVLRHRDNIDRLLRGVEPEVQVAEECEAALA